MRYNRILTNEKFQKLLNELVVLEDNRKFCRHGLDHLFDVARTAYIINLERGLGIDKDLIYAAALLHDLGRCEEYKNGMEHHIAGSKIAADILSETDFTDEEIQEIVAAIAAHRNESETEDLSGIIYMADKLTRPCFLCRAADECNWSESKKNYIMRY